MFEKELPYKALKRRDRMFSYEKCDLQGKIHRSSGNILSPKFPPLRLTERGTKGVR